jgi:hypothetical protein
MLRVRFHIFLLCSIDSSFSLRCALHHADVRLYARLALFRPTVS